MGGDPSDLDDLIGYLEEVRRRSADPSPLARAIGDILVAENTRARLAGLDAEGQELAPLRGGRALTTAEIRQRGGSGPPLLPRGMASRAISDFEVAIIPSGEGEVRVLGTWPRFGLILTLHAVGAGHLPVRDIIAPSRLASDLIDDAVDDFGRDLLGNSSRRP